MRVLLTGGTGLVGRRLLERAAEARRAPAGSPEARRESRDWELTFTGRREVLGGELARDHGARFLPLHLDQEDPGALAAACRDQEVVVHSAALSSPWGSREAFRQANLEGTRRLLAAAEQAGVRGFVHVSTPSLHFRWEHRLDIPESSPHGPVYCNHYAWSKAEAEALVAASPLPHAILRPRAIFGPHDTTLVPRLMRSVRGGVLRLPSRRNPLMDLTYVDNVCLGIERAVARLPDLESRIYHLTNAEPVRLFSLLEQLFEALGEPVTIQGLPYSLCAPLVAGLDRLHRLLPGRPEPRLTRYTAALLHYDQTLDLSRAREELGYAPEVDMQEGVRRFVEWTRGPRP